MNNVEICNLALSWLGEPQITALTDATPAARLCNALFASTLRALLAEREWSRAIAWQVLTPEAEAPGNPRFEQQFVVPAGTLRVLEVVALDEVPAGASDPVGPVVGFGGGFAALLEADTDVAAGPIEFTGTEYDDGTGYSADAGRYTVGRSGRWRVSAQVEVAGLTPSDSVRVDIYRNGTLALRGTLGAPVVDDEADTSYSAGSRCEAVLLLESGDYLEARLAAQTDAPVITLRAGGTRFEAQLLALVG